MGVVARILEKKINNLELELSIAFNQLLSKNEEIILFEEEDFDNGEIPDDYFERRNDISGEVIEICILKVDKNGIYSIDSDNNKIRLTIKFSDLNSIDDRIKLLGLIEDKLTK